MNKRVDHEGPVDPAFLRVLFDCNTTTGKIFHRYRCPMLFGKRGMSNYWNATFPGTEALTHEDAKGYLVGELNIWNRSISLKAHRVVWCLTHGQWPEGEIDHADHNPRNNTIENLSVVDRFGNMKNQSLSSVSKSGVTGVYWLSERNRWQAQIKCNGKRKTIGYFRDIESAKSARLAAQNSLGFHENHGKRR